MTTLYTNTPFDHKNSTHLSTQRFANVVSSTPRSRHLLVCEHTPSGDSYMHAFFSQPSTTTPEATVNVASFVVEAQHASMDPTTLLLQITQGATEAQVHYEAVLQALKRLNRHTLVRYLGDASCLRKVFAVVTPVYHVQLATALLKAGASWEVIKVATIHYLTRVEIRVLQDKLARA